MSSSRIRIVLLASVLLAGCLPSGEEAYRHIDFASCSWRIPMSYEAIRETTDKDFRFREKRPAWDNSIDVPLITFNRGKSTKESFEVSRSLHKDFRIVESEDFLLVQYQILIRDSGKVIGEGRKITVLVEKKTGDSVTLAAMDIKEVVSGCEIPNS